jgi:hypothetical protein
MTAWGAVSESCGQGKSLSQPGNLTSCAIAHWQRVASATQRPGEPGLFFFSTPHIRGGSRERLFLFHHRHTGRFQKVVGKAKASPSLVILPLVLSHTGNELPVPPNALPLVFSFQPQAYRAGPGSLGQGARARNEGAYFLYVT